MAYSETSIDIMSESLCDVVLMLRSFSVFVVGSETSEGTVVLRVAGPEVPHQPRSTCTVSRVVDESGVSLKLQFLPVTP